jgi:hypothetical protein
MTGCLGPTKSRGFPDRMPTGESSVEWCWCYRQFGAYLYCLLLLWALQPWFFLCVPFHLLFFQEEIIWLVQSQIPEGVVWPLETGDSPCHSKFLRVVYPWFLACHLAV